jgi:hypothetical protein
MSRGLTGRLLIVAISLVAAVGVIVAVRYTQQLPEGPVAVAWDREACAHCHMHVGEPAFAAQLQTTSGEVLNFDDPGCLFKYLEERRPAVHAIYFHHLREDRWMSAEETAFVPVSQSPMGYDLGAVERGTPGSIPLSAAREQVVRAGGTPLER